VPKLKFLTATVLARRNVTAGMVRVTLGGEELADLKSTGIGDEYIRLFFPDATTGELVLPETDERGFWVWPEGKKPAHCECYTIRNARPGEIDLDFVVHEGGIASEWAQGANPGDRIVIREPHGIYEAPPDANWFVFVADATGLPALGRLLEGLPAGSEARAIIEVPDAGHEQQLTSPAELQLVWLHGSGNGLGPSRLEEVLRSIAVPEGRIPYVWVVGEARSTRAIRKYLRHELGWSPTSYSVTGYWTADKEAWERSWAALDPGVKRQIDDLWASNREREEVTDEVEATLERFGL
jgi:NADPH-dependent ferric siderophore reductase